MEFDGEAFVDRFNTVGTGHDIPGILSMMTDDVIFEASVGKDPWGSRVVGKPAVREFLEEMFQRVPDIRWDEIRHVAHPELAVVEWLTAALQGCDLLALKDGKIAAKRSYRKGQL